eukprot:254235_1
MSGFQRKSPRSSGEDIPVVGGGELPEVGGINLKAPGERAGTIGDFRRASPRVDDTSPGRSPHVEDDRKLREIKDAPKERKAGTFSMFKKSPREVDTTGFEKENEFLRNKIKEQEKTIGQLRGKLISKSPVSAPLSGPGEKRLDFQGFRPSRKVPALADVAGKLPPLQQHFSSNKSPKSALPSLSLRAGPVETGMYGTAEETSHVPKALLDDLKRLQTAGEEKDAKILELEEKVDSFVPERTKLKESISKRDTKIKKLRTKIASLNTEIHRLGGLQGARGDLAEDRDFPEEISASLDNFLSGLQAETARLEREGDRAGMKGALRMRVALENCREVIAGGGDGPGRQPSLSPGADVQMKAATVRKEPPSPFASIPPPKLKLRPLKSPKSRSR